MTPMERMAVRAAVFLGGALLMSLEVAPSCGRSAPRWSCSPTITRRSTR
jgi:hypothetical protein